MQIRTTKLHNSYSAMSTPHTFQFQFKIVCSYLQKAAKLSTICYYLHFETLVMNTTVIESLN